MVAALALARAGHAVTLHDAAPVAGGRCRALPDGTDNGTHALMGAQPGGAALPRSHRRAGRLDRAGTGRPAAARPGGWVRTPHRRRAARLARPGAAAAGADASAACWRCCSMAAGITDRPVAAAMAQAPGAAARLRRTADRRRAEHAGRRGLLGPARPGAAAAGGRRRGAAAGGAGRAGAGPDRAGRRDAGGGRRDDPPRRPAARADHGRGPRGRRAASRRRDADAGHRRCRHPRAAAVGGRHG